MKNFLRAVRESLHHWPTLALATLCSLGVAALWSANIGAMYPVVAMTLEESSLQARLEKNIANIKTTHEAQTAVQAKLQEQLAAVKGQPEADSLQAKAKELSRQIAEIDTKLAWEEWKSSLANRYLPHDTFRTICVIMLVVVVSTVVKHLLMLANDLLVGKVSTTLVRSLRMKIFDQAMRYDRRTFQQYGTSTLLATITHTCEGLSIGLINVFGAAVREPLRVIACLIGAGILCPRLLMLSVVLAPLLILVVYWFNGRVKSIARTILNRNAGFHEVILEALSNIFTVQAYTMEKQESERFSSSTQDMQRIGMKFILYTGLSKPFTELVGVAMVSVTICAGAYLIVNKETHILFLKICDEPMTVTRLLLFFGMLIGASDPLRKMSGVITSIYTGAMAADSLYQLLDMQPAIAEPKNPVAINHPHRELSLQNVVFAYTPDCPVLQDINLQIPFGRTVAVVGANGCGKSTMIQLLCRFYDPVQGTISIDGIDFRNVSLHDLRERIALVSQNTELFNRTIFENISYGKPSATREEVIEAAKLAHAHEFITTALENGYETLVGQGGQKLSGGQRQRVAMARAILRKPEILILDEATSQVDMASELQIRQSLARLKGTCTIIIITHREALVALADETYEVKNGCLVASNYGAHKAA